LKKKVKFRSKLEYDMNAQIADMGLPFSYEGGLNTIRYIIPESQHRYLADFLLSNGIIIEAKGRFVAADRKKHLLIKNQFPILDVRFIFSNSKARIAKKSKTRYCDWCEKNGFLYADKLVPKEWLHEVKPKKELEEIIKLLKSFKRGEPK